MRQIKPGLPVRVRVAGARRRLRGVVMKPAFYGDGGPGAVLVRVGLRRVAAPAGDVEVIRRGAEAVLVLARDRALQGKRGAI